MSSLERSARYAWMVVALLLPVALLNYLDRQMLATMKASMVGDIPTIANKADWGLILGSFKWTYALLGPVAGYISDRFSRRWVIGASLLAWSVVTWWTGQATSFNELLTARAMMGISEAFYFPAALALITEYHLGPTRSRAVGVHQVGVYLGQIIGGFAGYVAEAPTLGWRWAFSTSGMIGVVYAIPLLALLRDPVRAPRYGSLDSARDESEVQIPRYARDDRDPGVVRGLLTNRNFILLVIYFTLPAIAGWIVRDWMPEILRERFSLGQGRAGVSAILFVQIASLVGAVVGGTLADRWMRHTPRGRIYASAIGMVLFLPALFSVGNAGTLGIAIAGLIVFGLGWGFFDSNNMPILSQIARPEWRATGYGIMNMVSISFGGFGDWAFGALRDREVPLNLIFGVFAGVALLSVVIVLMIRPRGDDAGAAA
ncbi:MAG TPA: MFS transporter [Gemmatimonadaceae bacterium]|nr:MFS transporter [Gemmatimonadaceae bacterium]